MVRHGKSPIEDADVEEYLSAGGLNLDATADARSAYATADIVVVAVPTNYDPDRLFFDTSRVEQVVALVLSVNPSATIVIKSTVPVGYTQRLAEKNPGSCIR